MYGYSSLSGLIAQYSVHTDGPAALGLDAPVARLRPRLLDAEAGAVRHLVEAVAQRLRPDAHRLEEHVVARVARAHSSSSRLRCGHELRSSCVDARRRCRDPRSSRAGASIRRSPPRASRRAPCFSHVGYACERKSGLMKTQSRKCSSVCGAAKKMRARALLADRLERELLGVDRRARRAGARTCAAPRGRARTSRSDVVRPPSSQPAACSTRSQPDEVRAPERHRRLRRRLGVERVGGRQAAAAAERQAVAARELAAGDRAEHRLGHAQRRAAAAHVDAREERAEEAPDAGPHGLRDRDAREHLGDLQREPGRDRHGRRRARQQERRHRDRLVGLRPGPHRVDHRGSPRRAGCWG